MLTTLPSPIERRLTVDFAAEAARQVGIDRMDSVKNALKHAENPCLDDECRNWTLAALHCLRERAWDYFVTGDHPVALKWQAAFTLVIKCLLNNPVPLVSQVLEKPTFFAPDGILDYSSTRDFYNMFFD